MQLKKAIETRKSVRKYNNKKPDWRTILECIDMARHAPMAGGNFSLKFILVDDPNSIQKLAEASQQNFVGQAKYIVVVCSDTKRTTNLYEKRGEIYARQQAGAAIQNFLLTIVEKKLSTCWIGHFVDDIVKKELKIPENIDVEAMFPIGFESGKNKTSKKIEMDAIMYFKKWGNKKLKPIKTLEV